MTLRYGLIGAGMMGHEHIENVALLSDAHIAAIADPDPGMRASAAAKAACPGFAHHREMLAAGGFDALIIAAPNHLHAPIMLEALEAGLPILCEKPLGVSAAECRAIEAKAAATGAPVWVAMEYRYMPPVSRLIERLRAGEAGAPRMLTIREHRFPFLQKVGDWNRFSAQTGGTLVEKCCHFFDMMRLILQAEPVRVYASGAMDVNHVDERYDGKRPDIIDNAYVIVDFAGGARAMLDLCMFAEGAKWQEEITVTGEIARLDARIPGPARFAPDGRERGAEVAISRRDEKVERVEPIIVDEAILGAGDHHGGTYFQHMKFRDLVRDGGAPEVGLQDGAKAVEIGAAAEESAATGRAITLRAPALEGAA